MPSARVEVADQPLRFAAYHVDIECRRFTGLRLGRPRQFFEPGEHARQRGQLAEGLAGHDFQPIDLLRRHGQEVARLGHAVGFRVMPLPGGHPRAGLEQRPASSRFKIYFRWGGQQFKRTVKTTNRSEAQAILLRLEENIGLVERGRLAIPPEADIATFLLADGKMTQPPNVSPCAL